MDVWSSGTRKKAPQGWKKSRGEDPEAEANEMAIRRTAEEWERIVEEYRRSGQTVTAWCKEHGVNAKTMGPHLREVPGRRQQRKRSAEEWERLIEEQRSSGLSRNAWCRKHGVSADSMTSAEKRLSSQRPTTQRPEWVEYNAGGKGSEGLKGFGKREMSAGMKIRAGGIEIEIDGQYPVEKVTELLGRLVKEC
jgi:transposase-like protein